MRRACRTLRGGFRRRRAGRERFFGFAGLAEQDRHGDDRDQEQGDERQQVAVAQVGVDVAEEAGHLQVAQALGQLDLGAFLQRVHRRLEAVAVEVPAASEGSVGLAPAVIPSPGGTR